MTVYKPRADSYLLATELRKLAQGNVLDVGTGSGILAITAATSNKVKNVTAADISKKAIETAKKNAATAKVRIRFIQSDLFKKIPLQSFDTIIFNPPHLPRDKEFFDMAIHGGDNGYEIIEKFLSGCSKFLAPKGMILLLFSSLTNKQRIDEIINECCLEKEALQQQSGVLNDRDQFHDDQ